MLLSSLCSIIIPLASFSKINKANKIKSITEILFECEPIKTENNKIESTD